VILWNYTCFLNFGHLHFAVLRSNLFLCMTLKTAELERPALLLPAAHTTAPYDSRGCHGSNAGWLLMLLWKCLNSDFLNWRFLPLTVFQSVHLSLRLEVLVLCLYWVQCVLFMVLFIALVLFRLILYSACWEDNTVLFECHLSMRAIAQNQYWGE
jgi:hypothetical protein